MGFIETLKDAVTLVQKTDNIDLVKQMLALQTQAQEMQAENHALRQRVGELEAILDFAKGLQFKAPFYYAPGDQTPFCQRCWEVDHRALHLEGAWQGKRWECAQCHHVYVIGE